MLVALFAICLFYNHLKKQNDGLLIYTLLNSNSNSEYFNVERLKKNRNNYAEKNGLFSIVEEVDIDPVLHMGLINWTKIRKYFDYNKKYEWIWYLDGDTFLMSTKSIFKVINEAKSSRVGLETDIIISKDCGDRVNSGSFIIRTSTWTNMFFEKWRNYENNTLLPKRDAYWEQAAIIYMIEKNILDVNDHLAIVDQKKINSYITGINCGVEYEKGDLVIHSPGRGFQTLSNYLIQNELSEV